MSASDAEVRACAEANPRLRVGPPGPASTIRDGRLWTIQHGKARVCFILSVLCKLSGASLSESHTSARSDHIEAASALLAPRRRRTPQG
jgi:hypothetical protein